MSSPGTNTSATGGPMLPNGLPAPLEGSDLLDLFQETLVALSGIDSNNVRPRFQTNPPDIPSSGTSWLSFGILRRPSDTVPYIEHTTDPINYPNGADQFQRQEDIVLLCSFYDDGSSGQAYGQAALVRDGLTIAQNMEALEQSLIYFGHSGELTILPSLLKQLWLFRVDLEITFRRQINRVYRTLNILSAVCQINTSRLISAGIGAFIIGTSAIGGETVDIIIIEEH